MYSWFKANATFWEIFWKQHIWHFIQYMYSFAKAILKIGDTAVTKLHMQIRKKDIRNTCDHPMHTHQIISALVQYILILILPIKWPVRNRCVL